MYEPPGLHSVKRLGEPRATPEPRSIGTSQTATALVSASLRTVSRRPSGNCSPVSAIRCPLGALNTTDEEPPASGIDSTADSAGPLVKSTRSPSALQVADPFGPRSTRCRGAEPSRGSTDRSRELPAILRSREPSGVEITAVCCRPHSAGAASGAADQREIPACARRRVARRGTNPCPVAAPGVHIHSARVCDPLRFACVDDADLNARRDRRRRGIFHLERCARMSPENQAGSR